MKSKIRVGIDLPNQLESKLQLTVGGCCAADGVETAKFGISTIIKVQVGHKWVRHRQERVIQEIKGFEPKLREMCECLKGSLLDDVLDLWVSADGCPDYARQWGEVRSD